MGTFSTISRSVADETGALARIVGQQAHAAHAEVVEDLCAHAVVALVAVEAEQAVRLHGVVRLPPAACRRAACSAGRCRVLPAACRPARPVRRARSSPWRACSCGPQSQRWLPKMSPVTQLLCTRTSTGSSRLPRRLSPARGAPRPWWSAGRRSAGSHRIRWAGSLPPARSIERSVRMR